MRRHGNPYDACSFLVPASCSVLVRTHAQRQGRPVPQFRRSPITPLHRYHATAFLRVLGVAEVGAERDGRGGRLHCDDNV